MFGTSIPTVYGGLWENIPFRNPGFLGGCGPNSTGASSNMTFCKLCSATMLLQASNDTYDRAKYLHNLFRVLELKLIINIENCSGLNFPLCETCLDMVRSLWVCQNTMDSLLDSRRILVGLLVDKARQGVSQDWRTGRAPPPPFCFLTMCSTLILDKQHLGHVKRIVADYFPSPTLNANEGGRMHVYPPQTLSQLNVNAQVNAGASERNRIHLETSQASVNTRLLTAAPSQPSYCPSSSTTSPGTSILTSSSDHPQASTSTNSVLHMPTMTGLELGTNKQMPPSTKDSLSGTQNGNKNGVIKERKEKMGERKVGLNNTVAGFGPIRKKLKMQGVEMFRHGKPGESKKITVETGGKPAESNSIPDNSSSSTPSTSTSCRPNATDADKCEWVPSIASVRGRYEAMGDDSEKVPSSTPQLNTALAGANATYPPINEVELGITSTEREGTISDDEIFELQPKGRNIMVNGVHIFECIGMFGSNKGKKFYQCGGCSFMLPMEPVDTSQTPAVERMATHTQNAHKSDSSSATHSIPPGQHGRNELKVQIPTTTSTCSLNASSKDGKRAYTLLSTPNMEPDAEAPSPKPSTSTMARQSSRKRHEPAGSSGADHIHSKKKKYSLSKSANRFLALEGCPQTEELGKEDKDLITLD